MKGELKPIILKVGAVNFFFSKNIYKCIIYFLTQAKKTTRNKTTLKCINDRN